MTIRLAHDFSCPWCWIGLQQAKLLRQEFGVDIEWLAYELYPEDLEFGKPKPPEDPGDKPPTPTRLELAYVAQGMEKPTNRGPAPVRTHQIHEIVEFAKTEGPPDDLIEAIYRAFWEQGADIRNLDTLFEIAKPSIKDTDAMVRAVNERQFAAKIVGFDESAYRTGVYHVPTFYIGGERYAEQPYVVLQRAMREAKVAR
ncbi:MAG: hypothetical protein QOJ65_174 [Fimbriimonadaceae bacterium]|jgi:predicted DsbA family dithiol-disulfide isomerase|nr:hypothetical protein [Fimbriimonadaceae bacterium]